MEEGRREGRERSFRDERSFREEGPVVTVQLEVRDWRLATTKRTRKG